jgi:type III secretion protein U
VSEKTEQPTARRLREARKKGQIPRSKLLSSAVVVLGGLLGLGASAALGFERLRDWTVRLLLHQEGTGAWEEGLQVMAWLAGPALGCTFLAALGVSFAMVGPELNAGHLLPRLERIDPVAGLKRLFSLRSVVELLKALAMVGVLTWLAWSEVSKAGAEVLRLVFAEGALSLAVVLELLERYAFTLVWLLMVLGLVDYGLARRRHLKDLMMTREEVKREYKQSEGDPHHKAQRQAVHRQLAQGGSARGVQKASVVVVNPTHLAVALRYETAECEAPYLVAKGREADAHVLRREAERLGIPIVRDVSLARSLIHYDVGEEIPEELYQAAAAVLRVAMERNGERA